MAFVGLRRAVFGLLIFLSLLLFPLLLPPSLGASGEQPTAQQATVVRELTEKRTASSETYLLSDGGHHLKIYDGDIRFKDEQGEWRTFDTDLVAGSVPGSYVANSVPVDVRIASDADGKPPVSVGIDEFSLDIDLLGIAERSPVVLGPGATFIADDQVSVHYVVERTGIEQTVVLASAKAPQSFSCLVSHPGLRLSKDESGQWGFYRPGDPQPLFEMSDLLVFDSSQSTAGDGAFCPDASMDVDVGKDESRLTYRVPRDWLEDPARVYPVRLDPSWVSCPRQTDTWVGSGLPWNSHGTEGELRSGRNGTPNAGYNRALVQFNVTPIPDNARITSSRVQIYRYSLTGSDTAVYVGKTKSWMDWSNASTWNGHSLCVAHPEYHADYLGQGAYYSGWLMLGDQSTAHGDPADVCAFHARRTPVPRQAEQ